MNRALANVFVAPGLKSVRSKPILPSGEGGLVVFLGKIQGGVFLRKYFSSNRMMEIFTRNHECFDESLRKGWETTIFNDWETFKTETERFGYYSSCCFRLHMDGCWTHADLSWNRLAEKYR